MSSETQTAPQAANPDWYFGPVLEAAIRAQDSNCARIKTSGHVYDLMSLRKWSRDFRTIRLDIGQRTGKTHAMSLMSTTEDALVLLNAGLRDHVQRNGFRGTIYSMEAVRRAAYDIRVGTGEPYHSNLKGHATIWVEPASLFTLDDLADVYTAFSRNIQQRFILLG